MLSNKIPAIAFLVRRAAIALDAPRNLELHLPWRFLFGCKHVTVIAMLGLLIIIFIIYNICINGCRGGFNCSFLNDRSVAGILKMSFLYHLRFRFGKMKVVFSDNEKCYGELFVQKSVI